MHRTGIGALLAGVLAAGPAAGAELTLQGINGAAWAKPIMSYSGTQPRVVKAQVLLDRALVSPGAIDGKYGGNTSKALRLYQRIHGLSDTGHLDRPTWQALTKDSKPALTRYKITQEDVNGPFVDRIPSEIRDQAKMDRLAYTSPRELLAEKFHMSQELLKKLNPGANFGKAGTSIVVARVGGVKPSSQVKTLVVDKKTQAVKAYDSNGKIIAFYPATVGSGQFPSPSGRVKVNSVAERPTFTYTANLDYARDKLKKGEKLVVAPGPNNPVGIVWIDLNKEGYGIHGTPEPTKISKTASHGCVRLTNWDAQELSGLVEKGTPVVFG